MKKNVSKYQNTPCSMCGKFIENPTKHQKEKFLISQGWKVLRFKNQEIMNDLQSCVLKVKSMI